MSIFLIVFFTIFIAEMGDKSLLILIAMSNKYKIKHILLGIILSIIVLNLLGVIMGVLLSSFIDFKIIKIFSGFLFLFFALNIIYEKSEENNQKKYYNIAPVLSIFLAFFLSELGDKTQLSVIAISANYVSNFFDKNIIFVFLGCTFGLILADIIGIAIGLYFKKKIPVKILNIISFLIFTIFGFITIFNGLIGFNFFINNKLLFYVSFFIFLIIYFIFVILKIINQKERKEF